MIMNWVTTNIRLPEDLYMELKIEAARNRSGIAALIREKLANGKKKSKKDIETMLKEMDEIAERNVKILKGKSLSKLLIEMRYEQ